MDFYRVKAKVYTEANISEGIPKNKWCYRLLLEGDSVTLVEAYWCENGGNGWGNAPRDLLDKGVFQEIVSMEPGFYESCNDDYDKYVSWVFSDVFQLEREIDKNE